MALSLASSVFKLAMAPVPPFNSPSLPSLSALDLLGAMRLSVALRQLRRREGGAAGEPQGTWFHDLWMTLVVVFGGELVVSAMLSTPPSFMLSPTVPLVFVASHTAASLLPMIPFPSIDNELPLAILDAATRSTLVCDFASSLIKNNPNPLLRTSPMALLVTSTVLGNGGFWFVNAFSMLSPKGWSVTTPPELKPSGWTTMDLWVAPLMTAIFATATHLQPFWVELQLLLLSALGSAPEAPIADGVDEKFAVADTVQPMSVDNARTLCFLLMATLFSGRAIRNFGAPNVGPVKGKINKGTNKAVGAFKGKDKDL